MQTLPLIDFILTVIIVTSSGVLSPGPLFFGTLLHGSKYGARAGLASSVGHTIVEFPLIIVLALGLLTIATQPFVARFIGLVGGTVLILFGSLQLRDALRTQRVEQHHTEGRFSRSSLVLGLILTGLNPFFILWWLTIGVKIILDAIIFASLIGVLIMYASHIWMDYVWLTTIAHFARRGRNLVGSRGYRLILVAFSLALVYFGANFIFVAVQSV